MVVGARRATDNHVLTHVCQSAGIERLGGDGAVVPDSRQGGEPVIAMHILQLGPGAIERAPHVVVRVDQAWNHDAASRVDRLVGLGVEIRTDLGDCVVADEHIA